MTIRTVPVGSVPRALDALSAFAQQHSETELQQFYRNDKRFVHVMLTNGDISKN